MEQDSNPSLVHYEVAGGFCTITLDAPSNRNALSTTLVRKLAERLTEAAAASDVRGVVLTATGTVFCAGADLRSSTEDLGASLTLIAGVIRQMIEMPKPVIARINGHVRAGGLGIVGAADIAICEAWNTFAFTEVRLGLAPGVVSATTLDRMTSRSAQRYYLTGEAFDGDAAAAAGLVTEVVEEGQLDAAVARILDALRSTSPTGLRETKSLLRRAKRIEPEDALELMPSVSARLFGTAEAQEGVGAFLDRRRPSWVLDDQPPNPR